MPADLTAESLLIRIEHLLNAAGLTYEAVASDTLLIDNLDGPGAFRLTVEHEEE